MATTTSRRLTKHQMKEDAFVTGVFTARQWLSSHTRQVTIGIGAVIIAVAAVWFFLAQSGNRAQEAAVLFGRASVEMRTGNNALAAIDLRKLIDEYGSSAPAGRGCYMLGQAHFRQRSFIEAENSFKQYISDYGKDALLKAAAYAGIAACREQSDDWAGSYENYMLAAKINLGGFQAPDFLTSAVRVAAKMPDAEKARDAYNLLIEHFSDTPSLVDPVTVMMIENGFLDPASVE